ncbi:MAG TPA: hypothetical protein VGM90_24140 [Kofleriaceae bacterium]|jgi:hypothetical protein
MTTRISIILVLALAACGSSKGGSNNGDGGIGDDGGVDPTGDGGCTGLCTDAPPFTGTCDPNGPQCANCIDDDGDGFIDGDDINCSGPLDNDEGSFSTGIPGDNIDAVEQDCFFDGNSGAGNDGCNIHVCCILGAHTKAECPIGANRFNPDDCPPPIGTHALSQKCIDTCGAITPPGCDCFGCCTICDPANPGACYDIATNATTSPDCTSATLADPTKCHTCVKTESCGTTECGGTTCILCPGQDPSTLPASCNNTTACPTGENACGAGDTCAAGFYCATGCCIPVIQ